MPIKIDYAKCCWKDSVWRKEQLFYRLWRWTMIKRLMSLLACMLGLSMSVIQAQPIDLDDITEIKGYQAPPDMNSQSTKHVDSPRTDIKGAELKTFLRDYVYVKNEDVVASSFSSADATAMFGNQEMPVTFMYAACPWENANLGMIQGKPHLMVFVVNHDFVMFQLKNLCANPPPGFKPERKK